MIESPNNSDTTRNSAPWICQGISANSHPEIENWGDSCMFPGCKNNREDLSKAKSISPSSNDRKLKPILGIALAIVASLGSGLYLWQKFKPCPEGQEKLNGTCSVIDKPESQGSAPGNSTDQINLVPRTNNNTLTTPIPFNPEWISQSDRVLFKGNSNKYRDNGIEAFKQGNYAVAIKNLEKAVFSDRSDPEVQIYLNNAQASFQGSPLKIAVVVPVENKETSAKEMLRGIADAQTQFNYAGGAGGKLVQVDIANDGNEPQRAQTIAQKLASDLNILGIIGHNSSSASEIALFEYEKANLAIISPTSTSTSLKSNYFYRTVPSDEITGKKLAQYADQTGINRVAVFYNPHSSYSKSLQNAFEAHFQKLGGKVSGSIDLSDSNFDPRQQIQALQGRIDAIALFPNTNTTSVAIGIARANTELSAQKLPMIGGDALYSSQTLNNGGSAVDDLVIAVPWFATNQPYAEQANQRWMGTVNWRTAASYDATQALLKAIAASPNPTRSSVEQNLRLVNLVSSETSGEPLSFTNGERSGDGVLVQIAPGALGKPREMINGFKLIEH
ncbi:ABC transporter substrate-binding protein [Pleurocapsa sp. PCC 7319]|uniref:ABC transporter substrate-binding protein n=1 Tax=Pleurocapsa sp. PCC 7319 TaxID=118161 RepID=UPI0003483E73|nr:ABC transporter substrate-binding protein [Pleurocapsa sp. PCC 7319]